MITVSDASPAALPAPAARTAAHNASSSSLLVWNLRLLHSTVAASSAKAARCASPAGHIDAQL